MRDRPSNRAFTLIEGLTVMAVVTVVLSVTLPALHFGRTVAQRVDCQSHLRQLALAWDLYLQDEDGRFYQWSNANLSYGGWQGQVDWSSRVLNPYVGLPVQAPNEPDAAALFRCPADRTEVSGTGLPAFGYFGNSYQTNLLLIGQNEISTKVPMPWKALHAEINQHLEGVNRLQTCNPSRLLLLGDYAWANGWMPRAARTDGCHGGGNTHNLAFLDGHVEFLKLRKGLYVTDTYVVLPFESLHARALEVQVEEEG